MFFFFKQETAYEMRISDWSSDVCSSDLLHGDHPFFGTGQAEAPPMPRHWRRLPGASRVRTGVARPSNPVAGIGPKYRPSILSAAALSRKNSRSEERRVGKEWVSTGRFWWSPYH